MSSGGLDRYVSWLRSKAEGEPFGTIVVRHGKIACEYYGSGAHAGSKWEIGSIRKSVASALLGMAISEGKLSLDTVVHDLWPEIHQITGAEKDKQIRMRHLASNASGWMTKSRPGKSWLYNNAACTAGGAVIGRVYGMPGDRIAALVVERIANAVGANDWEVYHFDGQYSPGNYGRPGPKLAIDSTLRDLARYGYLWLRDGEWNGVQLIPREYVLEARRNQVADLGGHYGYWWFTNDGRVLLPSVPEDAFYHIGNGRENRRTVLLVVPSMDLVAVVGAGSGAYNITKGYKAQPVTQVNEWIGKIAEAVQSVRPIAPTEQLHFPPPGESLAVQSHRTPAQAGFDPAVLSELEDVATRWALWRHGHLIHVKGDFNKTGDVASNRKTWHALTVGAAIQQGKIPSIHQKISVWNQELSGKEAEATWRHVITQSAGFDYPYGEYPAYKPGKMWTYSDYNPVQLCNALARVYGRKDYTDTYDLVVKEAYFDAIGMRGWSTRIKKDHGFFAPNDGIRFHFDLEDMGRLSLLVVARGRWNGRQLIPERFVKELEKKQTYGMLVNYQGPNDGKIGLDPKKFREVPYGFMTWVNTDGDFYAGADRAWAFAMGARGNYTLWNHKFGIVFAAVGAPFEPTTHGVPHILEAHLKK
jgi:CubicO group peptidase (beta-lactamase class C family)